MTYKAQILDQVRDYWPAYESLSQELRSDRDIAMAALQQSGYALKSVPSPLCDDYFVVLTAVQTVGAALKYAPVHLRDDKAIVLIAVTNDADALIFASDRLKSDPEVLAAVSVSSESFGVPGPERQSIIVEPVDNSDSRANLPSPSSEPSPITEIDQPIERMLTLDEILSVHSTIPAEFSGQNGSNRADLSANQIDAKNDLEAINSWLDEHRHSPNTFRAFRKEIERFLTWCWHEIRKPISSVKKNDLIAYREFLADPQPVDVWVQPKRTRKSSKDWRPFSGPLSESSQVMAMRVIGSLFAYLCNAGYLSGNPAALIKNKTGKVDQSAKRVERYLERRDVQAIKSLLEHPPVSRKSSDPEYAAWIRDKTLITFLLNQAPRCSEISAARMNDFIKIRDKWWWAVEGKGMKKAEIPLMDEMLLQLMEYRQYLGLSQLPSPDEDTPFLRDLHGRDGVESLTVYRMVKKICSEAAKTVDDVDPESASRLRQASTHWFRHTAITYLADQGVPLKMVSATARHSDLNTTAIYFHEDRDVWHRTLNKKPSK